MTSVLYTCVCINIHCASK